MGVIVLLFFSVWKEDILHITGMVPWMQVQLNSEIPKNCLFLIDVIYLYLYINKLKTFKRKFLNLVLGLYTVLPLCVSSTHR